MLAVSVLVTSLLLSVYIFSLLSGSGRLHGGLRIWGPAFFLNRLSATSSYLGSDFPATSRRLVLSIPETSVDSLGYTRLYFNLLHSQFKFGFPSSESVSTPVFLSLSLCAYLKMKISSPPFSTVLRGKAGEHLYLIHHIELKVIYLFFSIGMFLFYFYLIRLFK